MDDKAPGISTEKSRDLQKFPLWLEPTLRTSSNHGTVAAGGVHRRFYDMWRTSGGKKQMDKQNQKNEVVNVYTTVMTCRSV